MLLYVLVLHVMIVICSYRILGDIFKLALCLVVTCKYPCIIYDFGVESSQESIGEVSFAIGTISGDDLF